MRRSRRWRGFGLAALARRWRPRARSGGAARPTTRRSARRARAARPRSSTTSANAFAIAIPSLDRRASGARSRSATASSTTTGSPRRRRPSGRDGLGPLFNAQSCSTCHFHDGRAAAARRRRRSRARPAVPAERARHRRPRRRRARARPTATSSRTGRSLGVPPEGRVAHHLRGGAGRRSPTARSTRCSRRRYEIVDLSGTARSPPTCWSRRASRRASSASACSRRCPTPRSASHADPDDADGDGISGRAELGVGRRPPAAWRSAASGGRPTCRRSSSRTPARSPATSASRARCSPSSRAPRREAACLRRRRPAAIPSSTTTSSTGSPSTRARSRCPARRDVRDDEVQAGRAAVPHRRLLVVSPAHAAHR